MLFDPRPKERRDEIFDREGEIEALLNGMKNYPITLLIGIRRVGKSSLLRVALNECDEIGLYIDARKLYSIGGSVSQAGTGLGDKKHPRREGARGISEWNISGEDKHRGGATQT
ncbi:hypothetical protein [Thermococcus sp.]|uniref:hypothetical protein n=1 Tax=Thermococcus sp. TaxID=35749 RepID=UPI00345C91EF